MIDVGPTLIKFHVDDGHIAAAIAQALPSVEASGFVTLDIDAPLFPCAECVCIPAPRLAGSEYTVARAWKDRRGVWRWQRPDGPVWAMGTGGVS